MLESRVFKLGRNDLIFTASDSYHNKDFCTTIIKVKDKEPPTFFFNDLTGSLCNSTITSETQKGECGARLSWRVPSVRDNCPNAKEIKPKNIHTGHFFPVSSAPSVVTYKAIDASGNEASCPIRFRVFDTEPPVLKCKNATMALPKVTNSLACADRVSHSVVCEYSDNCKGGTYSCDHREFAVGTTRVKCTAVDSAGLKTVAHASITVTDNERPFVVSCPKNISLAAGKNIPLWAPPVADDNSCANIKCTEINERKVGSSFDVGTTGVSYTCKDPSGNENYCDFSVKVNISLPSNLYSCDRCPVLNTSRCLPLATNCFSRSAPRQSVFRRLKIVWLHRSHLKWKLRTQREKFSMLLRKSLESRAGCRSR